MGNQGKGTKRTPIVECPNNDGRDEAMTILSSAGGRAYLRTVVDELHQEPPEETVARNRFSTPQNPKVSFSACTSNTISNPDGFFSPGREKRGRNRAAIEMDAEDGKDEYILVDLLICTADNYCQSGRLT